MAGADLPFSDFLIQCLWGPGAANLGFADIAMGAPYLPFWDFPYRAYRGHQAACWDLTDSAIGSTAKGRLILDF